MMRRPMLALFAALWVVGAMPVAARLNEQQLVSTEWLQQHRFDRRLTIVEIGDAASYIAGHIAGARFVALSDLLIARDSIPNELPDVATLEKTLSAARIPDRGRIILYSRDLIAAARAFFTLDALGHGESTSILDGGFAKWSSEGRPIESGPAAIAAGGFSARPRPEVLVRLTALRTILYAAERKRLPLTVVDARAPEQFCAGFIPTAINVPWNFTEEQTVIVYCRTGMQASVTYFVMRYYLGRDVHLCLNAPADVAYRAACDYDVTGSWSVLEETTDREIVFGVVAQPRIADAGFRTARSSEQKLEW